jgi:cold shock CspA family protein
MSNFKQDLDNVMANIRTGTVDWFNNTTGEGMVRCDASGEWFFVHYSSFSKSVKLLGGVSFGEDKNCWIIAPKGARVVFEVDEDRKVATFAMISKRIA